MSTCLGLFARANGMKSNLPEIVAKMKLQQCLVDEWLFDNDAVCCVFKKLLCLSKHVHVSTLLCEIIENDKGNDLSSIVFIARQLGRRGKELDILTQEEADELNDITDVLLEMLKAKKKLNILKYDLKSLENAVDSVKSGQMSVRKAAVHYNVPKSTVGDRVTGKRNIEVGRGRKPALPLELENSIVKSVKRASQLGVGISRRQLLARTGTLVKKLKIKTPFKNSIPGKDWWQNLKERHTDLVIRKPEKTGSLRCRMMNKQKVEEYFQALEKVLTEKDISKKPKMIWNMDETGKSFEHDPVKVLAEKGTRNVPGRTSAMSTHVTIVACVNAEGQKMSPLLIVQGKTERSVFGFNTTEAPSGTMWDYQDSGWMSDRIGEKWFKDIFLKQCGVERPQLLILDGHSSHESLALIQEGIRENIVILSLPPHTTHYLQPLDRSVFGPFNKQYDRACSEFLQENMLHKIDKWTFPSLFKTAWNEALSKQNIKSGFRACGIYPFNPHAIPPEAYLPSEASENKVEAPTFDQPSEKSNAHCSITAPVYSATAIPTTSGDEIQVCSASAIPTASGDEMVSIENEEQASTMSEAGDFVQPEIEDPEALLQLILDDKIHLVGTADDDGTIELSESWNNEVNSLFLPFESNAQVNNKDTPVTQTKKPNNVSKQSHRLLTSEEVVQEKLLMQQRKEEKEKKKEENKLKKIEREIKKAEATKCKSTRKGKKVKTEN